MSQNNQIKQYNFTQEQITKLFTMQDQLNTYIHPEWKTQGFNWDLAIVDECMEIHGHLGWKWWKKDYKVGLTEANKKQVQLEVIDILHFVISSMSEKGFRYIFLLEINEPHFAAFNLAESLKALLKIAGNYISSASEYAWIFRNLAHSVELTEQEILETYTQKYVLNKFRQDHGYKDGSYVKEWDIAVENPQGVFEGWTYEDNEVLTRLVTGLQMESKDTTDEIELYNRLELAYNSRLNQ